MKGLDDGEPGDVNDFRGDIERRLGRAQRLFGNPPTVGPELEIPNYEEYTARREAQQGLLDRACRLFGMQSETAPARPTVPEVSRPTVATPEVPPIRAVPPYSQPRVGAMPFRLGHLGFIPQIYQAMQEMRNDPPMYDARGNYLGRASDMYGEVAAEGAGGPETVQGEERQRPTEVPSATQYARPIGPERPAPRRPVQPRVAPAQVAAAVRTPSLLI